MMARQIQMAIGFPGGSTDIEGDEVVMVVFTEQEGVGGQRRMTFRIWTGSDQTQLASRKTMLKAAKALLAKLAENTSDGAGKAAARALERVHRKL